MLDQLLLLLLLLLFYSVCSLRIHCVSLTENKYSDNFDFSICAYLSLSLVSEIFLTNSMSKPFRADQQIIIYIYIYICTLKPYLVKYYECHSF
jgi:hypothetical protein